MTEVEKVSSIDKGQIMTEVLTAPDRANFQAQFPLASQERSVSFLTSFVQELYNERDRCMSRWLLFNVINRGQTDLSAPRAFYFAHAQALVPSLDLEYKAEIRYLKKSGEPLPSKKEFLEDKVLHIFDKDKGVAEDYRSRGGLQDLIDEAQARIDRIDASISEKQGELLELQMSKISRKYQSPQ